MKLTDLDLLYSATARCRCGAGLAYPHATTNMHGSWDCSAVLKGEIPDVPEEHGKHDSLPWMFYKVREETSINNRGGATTRPAGTIARTVGTATCGQCGHVWQSEPYNACGLGNHWRCGPCPGCGNENGAKDGVPYVKEGRIDCRYRDVFLPDPVAA